jgi:hypothetical protein
MSKPPCWYNYDLAHRLKFIAPRLDISASEMAVLESYVTEFHDDTQESWVDQSLMAKRIKLSTETIRCATRELEDKHLLQFIRNREAGSTVRVYKVTLPQAVIEMPLANTVTPVPKRDPQPVQTVKNRSVI